MAGPIIDGIDINPNPANPGQQVRVVIRAHDPDNRIRRFQGTARSDDGEVFDFRDLVVQEAGSLTYALVEVDPATNQPLPTQPTITPDPAVPGAFTLTA